MAAAASSPSGFSYAQAAKGRSPATTTAQTPTSKATSGAATPATGPFTELASGGNWADDVEASVSEKPAQSQSVASGEVKCAMVKESTIERAKTEDHALNSPSGTSSPDLMASTSTSAKDEDSSTTPANGSSSETTWETKSSASEPAWIADRKERQASSQKHESAAKVEKKSGETSLPSPPKPVLQEAKAPAVNIWQQRAQEAKAKLAAASAKPPPSTSQAPTPVVKENQRPRADSRKKAMSVDATPAANGRPMSSSGESPRISRPLTDPRSTTAQLTSRLAADITSATPSRASGQSRSSVPTISSTPAFVQDNGAWPTPENAQEPERRNGVGRASPDKGNDESTSSDKPRQKQGWAKLEITPNVIYENNNARGADGRRLPQPDRGGRGGSLRGRGGLRGGGGASGGDRAANRESSARNSGENAAPSGGRNRLMAEDRDAMPPPPKPARASSDSTWRAAGSTSVQATSRQDSPDISESAEKTDTGNGANLAATITNGQLETIIASDSAAASTEGKEAEHIPEPIPRRSSIGTQTDAPVNSAPIRMIPTDGRRDPRSFEGHKDAHLNGPSRGAKRGGRGRGGAREYANGHGQHHSYGNNDAAGAPGFSVPPSPSHHSGRGATFAYPQRGGGNWRGPRSASIPYEQRGFFSQFNGYGSPQPPPVNTFMNGDVYAYNGYPVSAMQYQPFMEQQYFLGMVSMQLEYYFSMDNLLKDMFLRKNMDSQGFVFLNVVANFNRLKQLTQDRQILKNVCLDSENIEIRVGEDGKERLRRRDGYEQFILPMDQRAPEAQTDGPKEVRSIERPVPPPFNGMPPRGPAGGLPPSMNSRHDRRSYDSMTPNGLHPQFVGYQAGQEGGHGQMLNSDDVRGRAAKSPIREDLLAHSQRPKVNGELHGEPDAFPDAQAEDLQVMIRLKADRPYHTEASRTFSNGSIDSPSIFAELDKPANTQKPSLPNGADNPTSEHSRHISPNTGRATERNGGPPYAIFWMKEPPSGNQPLPNDVSHEPYHILRRKALDQRDNAATGNCPYDLDVLYKFWSHFLLRNFNGKMYTEFHFYALEDASIRHNGAGIHCLIKFYDEALRSSNPIRERVAKDYVLLVANEPVVLEGAAFKQLRAALRDGALNLKNRKMITDVIRANPGLEERLRDDLPSAASRREGGGT